MTGGVRWTMFAAYVVTSVAGLAILKNSFPRLRVPMSGTSVPELKLALWVACGATLYIISFGLWLLILRTLPLAVAYPAAVGATLCGTSAVAVFVLGERIGIVQGTGIALVAVGVVLVFRGG